MDNRAIAEQIFLAGVESVLPSGLIPAHLYLKDKCLYIGQHVFPLSKLENIFVIGAGKASGMMALEVEKILGKRISEGHIVVKYGYASPLKFIRTTEAGHPVPDFNGFEGTEAILEIARKAQTRDLVICLLSGGGSALLSDFPDGSSPEEMMHLNGLLVNSGANIEEINAVRKHLSAVKGGQLARTVYPAILVSLILSDVPGDPLNVIASGPTTPDPSTFQQATGVLEKYNLLSAVSGGIRKYLEDGMNGSRPETPKQSDPVFEKAYNILIGTNRLALEAAERKAVEYNLNTVIIDNKLQGETSSAAEYIFEIALSYKDDINEKKPVCLLFGGETTVKVTGTGMGGRNQHLALFAAGLLQNQPGITILSAGTDGSDGPTSAAGAVVDSHTYRNASSKNINPAEFLQEFDSYHFFNKTGGHIITGPTMTNVMDIIVVIID